MKSVEKLFLSSILIGMLVSTALAQETTISSQFNPPIDPETGDIVMLKIVQAELLTGSLRPLYN